MGPKLLKDDVNRIDPDEGDQEGAPPLPDNGQLKLAGVKPAAIEEVENAFDAYIEALGKKESAATRMNDSKEVLLTRMKENKVPMYGKKVGKFKYIAAINIEETVLVKKQKPDRK